MYKRPFMPRTSTSIALALLAAVTTLAQDHAGQYPAADVTAGSRVYSANCASCHGPSGVGVGGIDLRRGRLPRAPTDEALAALVATGIPGTGMPAFRFTPDGNVVFLQGDFRSQDFWLANLATGEKRQLTKLKTGYSIRSFDVSPDGKEIMFDRVQENSDIVLIDLQRR